MINFGDLLHPIQSGRTTPTSESVGVAVGFKGVVVAMFKWRFYTVYASDPVTMQGGTGQSK